MFIQIGFDEQFHLPAFESFDEFLEELNDLLGEDTYLIENNGKKIDLTSDYQLIDDEVYKIWPKVSGGKGGFGSLLRSFGKQILISKNKEACRDLNGRRMRDVNNEKRLKEWAQKQLEKPSTSSNDSKKKAHEEEADYRNVAPPSEFTETPYKEQKKQISDDMDEAVRVAAELIRSEKSKKKSATAVSTNDPEEESPTRTSTKKRRHSDDTLEEGELTNKKNKNSKGASAAFFVGIDLDDVSSDEEDEADVKQKKKK